MPIPSPSKGMSEKDFTSACMGHQIMLKEFPDQKQRYAVCMQKYRDRNKKMHHNEITVKANWTTKKWRGKDYIVAPVVILQEGVHNGLFYPSQELQKTAHLWNGVPIVVQHPTLNGTPISANSPDVYEKQGVGRLFNTKFDNSKLKGELFIDSADLGKFPEVKHYLEKDVPLEVSTGLFSDDEALAGKWGGKSYSAIVRNHKPDHLALLPGGVGACSFEDGCGVRVNQRLDNGAAKTAAEISAATYRRSLKAMAAKSAQIFINSKE